MAKNEKQENQKKRGIFRVTKFSRRQFLKRVTVAAAGAAIASISLTSACKSSSSTAADTTTNVNPISGPATSSAPVTSATAPSSGPPTSSTTAPTSAVPTATSTIPATSTPAVTSYSYVPPTVLPPLLIVAGTTCNVATDRVYSADHIWVKSLSANIVVMGITPTMVEILGEPYKLSLLQVGTPLSLGDAFGTIEGYKITADLITPVSGVVFEVDEFVLAQSSDGGQIGQINDDPYNSGWMIVVQLSKPSELNALMTAQSYIHLVSK